MVSEICLSPFVCFAIVIPPFWSLMPNINLHFLEYWFTLYNSTLEHQKSITKNNSNGEIILLKERTFGTGKCSILLSRVHPLEVVAAKFPNCRHQKNLGTLWLSKLASINGNQTTVSVLHIIIVSIWGASLSPKILCCLGRGPFWPHFWYDLSTTPLTEKIKAMTLMKKPFALATGQKTLSLLEIITWLWKIAAIMPLTISQNSIELCFPLWWSMLGIQWDWLKGNLCSDEPETDTLWRKDAIQQVPPWYYHNKASLWLYIKIVVTKTLIGTWHQLQPT